MFSKLFILALAASPLVAAHGKIAVMVSLILLQLFEPHLTEPNRLVMPVETPLVSVSKEVSSQVPEPTSKPKSTPPSSTARTP